MLNVFSLLKEAATKRKILFWPLAAICVLGVLLVAAPRVKSYIEFRKLEAKISSNPAWAELYKKAREGKELLKDPKSEEEYLAAGFRWKSLADATGEKVFYLKALEIYDMATERKDFAAFLSNLNAGNVSRAIKEFERADKYYLKAIQLNPGEAGTYMARAELLRYGLGASSEEIKKFYLDSFNILFGVEYVRLVADYAAYLKETGDYKEALKQYEFLLTVMPGSSQFLQSVGEIEDKLKAATP